MADVGRFVEKAKQYTNITELTPELLRTFISRIVVHEKSEKYSRSAEQKIEIHYNHIGAMDYAEYVAHEETERTA